LEGQAAAGELKRRVGAALAAEGVAQLGEAVELAVLREESAPACARSGWRAPRLPP